MCGEGTRALLVKKLMNLHPGLALASFLTRTRRVQIVPVEKLECKIGIIRLDLIYGLIPKPVDHAYYLAFLLC